jgi:Spy/CpxP family protein refolding chaperone
LGSPGNHGNHIRSEGDDVNTFPVGILLAVAVITAPSNGMAEMKGMSDGGMKGMHDMPTAMGGDAMDLKRVTHALSSLNLTSEQTTSLKRLRIQHQKEAIPLLAKVRQANLEIEELELAEKLDIKKIEVVLNQKHDTLAKLEVSHIDLIQKMKAVLTPAQRQELEAILEHGPKSHGDDQTGDHEQHGQSNNHMGH